MAWDDGLSEYERESEEYASELRDRAFDKIARWYADVDVEEIENFLDHAEYTTVEEAWREWRKHVTSKVDEDWSKLVDEMEAK